MLPLLYSLSHHLGLSVAYSVFLESRATIFCVANRKASWESPLFSILDTKSDTSLLKYRLCNNKCHDYLNEGLTEPRGLQEAKAVYYPPGNRSGELHTRFPRPSYKP
jgi:hypothetical protein